MAGGAAILGAPTERVIRLGATRRTIRSWLVPELIIRWFAQLLLGLFLFLHGAIHLSFIAPTTTRHGWRPPLAVQPGPLVDPVAAGATPELTRVLGLALTAVTFAAFSLAAISTLGLIPAGLWEAAVALGAGSSIGLLLLFFQPWLMLGLVIDVACLVAVFVAGWSPATLV